MKRRAMKKWIPKGMYCSGCRYKKYITTIKLNSHNCKYASSCDDGMNNACWSTPENSCRHVVYKCEYLNFVDWEEETLLWDGCKECGVKDFE